ncbi:GTP-binding protein [Streptomyces sp. SBR177]
MNDAQWKPERTPKSLVLIGGPEHGKTTLASAVTRFCDDRQAEYFEGPYQSYEAITQAGKETVQGSTASRVQFATRAHSYTMWDYASYQDGLTGIPAVEPLDGALLVVSVVDHVGQAREQLSLLAKRGVRKIAVFLNKCDLTGDSEIIDMADIEIRETLSELGFDGKNVTIVDGSATQALNGTPEGTYKVERLLNGLTALFS